MAHQAKVLAFDIGGTKVVAGVVDHRGRVLNEIREQVVFADGKKAVLDQLTRLGRALLKQTPGIKICGVASAGPLDPARGLLLDPTHFRDRAGKTWGVTPLTKLLQERLKVRVIIENDAAAAALAEAWRGAARGVKNAIILTLGTGLGTGVICNGQLTRAGRGLHTEGGHIILHADDASAPCGCGNLGCAEAYLSGRAFAVRAQKIFGVQPPDGAQGKLTGELLTAAARRGNPAALRAFADYAHWMAVAVHNYCVLYCPEKVILTGGFAEATDLFLSKAETDLQMLLSRRRVNPDLLPKFAVSELANQAGVIGGARIAFLWLKRA